MSKRIIIPKGLVNPEETTIIEIPADLDAEPELIASPASCRGSQHERCTFNRTESIPESPPVSFRTPQATSTPKAPEDDFTYSTLEDSSYNRQRLFEMTPETSMTSSAGSYPGSFSTSQRSSRSSRSMSLPNRLNRTQNVCPGGGNTFNADSNFGRTQNLPPDKTFDYGINRTNVIPESPSLSFRISQTPSRLTDDDFTPSGSVGSTLETSRSTTDSSYPSSRSRRSPARSSRSISPTNRTQSVCPGRAAMNSALTTMGTTGLNSTFASPRGAVLNSTFGSPQVCATMGTTYATLPPNQNSALDATYSAPTDPSRTFMAPSNRTFNEPAGFNATYSTPQAASRTFAAPQNRTFNAPASSVNRTYDAAPNLGQTQTLSRPCANATYDMPPNRGPCPGISSSFHIPLATSTPKPANASVGNTFTPTPFTYSTLYDTSLYKPSQYGSSSPSRYSTISRPSRTYSISPKATKCTTYSKSTSNRRNGSLDSEGFPSFHIPKATSTPRSMNQDAGGTYNKSLYSTLYDSSLFRSSASGGNVSNSSSILSNSSMSKYDYSGRSKSDGRKTPSPCAAFGVLGNAYLAANVNETLPPQIPSDFGVDANQSVVDDIQVELQEMEDTERSQLEEDLRNYQQARRTLMSNTAFTFGERSTNVSGSESVSKCKSHSPSPDCQ